MHQRVVFKRLFDSGQSVVRRDAEDEGHITQVAHFEATRVGMFAGDTDGQVDLARDQCFPGTGQDFVAQAQARGRAGVFKCACCFAIRIARAAEGLHQLEHRRHGDDVVDADRQLRFPAAGDAAHAIRHSVDFLQQPAPFAQQLGAGGGELRLA